MKIGVFVGSFDPFHLGHYSIVRALKKTRLVDEVFVFPTSDDKTRVGQESVLHRCNIIKKWDVRTETDVRDWIKLQKGHHDLYLITGSDAPNLKLGLTRRIIIERDGYIVPNPPKPNYDTLVFRGVPNQHTSSTIVRDLYYANHPGVNALMCARAARYIQYQGLYTPQRQRIMVIKSIFKPFRITKLGKRPVYHTELGMVKESKTVDRCATNCRMMAMLIGNPIHVLGASPRYSLYMMTTARGLRLDHITGDFFNVGVRIGQVLRKLHTSSAHVMEFDIKNAPYIMTQSDDHDLLTAFLLNPGLMGPCHNNLTAKNIFVEEGKGQVTLVGFRHFSWHGVPANEYHSFVTSLAMDCTLSLDILIGFFKGYGDKYSVFTPEADRLFHANHKRNKHKHTLCIELLKQPVF
jgi:cytidyltransferase-like protein